MTPRSNALERPQSEAKAPSRALDACPTALKAHREILVLARRGHQICQSGPIFRRSVGRHKQAINRDSGTKIRQIIAATLLFNASAARAKES
jgi:hypothetical protein